MIFLINLINSIFDLTFAPFVNMNLLWGISIVSLVTGVVMLIIFSYTSDQQGIKETKEKIKGYLLEIRLFKDDLQQNLRSQKQILKYNLLYMKHSLKPMVVMIIPVILIMVQLDNRYSIRPFKAGEKALICLKLADNINPVTANIELKLPAGVTMDASPLRIEKEGEIDWRVRVDTPGDYELKFLVGNETITKKLVAEPRLARLSSELTQASLSQLLITPGESPIPSSAPVKEIKVVYPEMHIKILGRNVHWMVLFFVLSIVSAFALKGVFKVQI